MFNKDKVEIYNHYYQIPVCDICKSKYDDFLKEIGFFRLFIFGKGVIPIGSLAYKTNKMNLKFMCIICEEEKEKYEPQLNYLQIFANSSKSKDILDESINKIEKFKEQNNVCN